jgi:hypothetical protein
MGACVRVGKNFFENVGTAVMMAYSPQVGSVQLIDNQFGTSTVATTPACELNVPYDYSDFLDDVNDLPMLIAGDVLPLEKN